MLQSKERKEEGEESKEVKDPIEFHIVDRLVFDLRNNTKVQLIEVGTHP